MESLRSRNEKLAAEVSRLHAENKILKARIRKYVAKAFVIPITVAITLTLRSFTSTLPQTSLKSSWNSREEVQKQRDTDDRNLDE